MLYKKLAIPNFNQIQKDLQDFTKLSLAEEKRYWDVSWNELESTTPSLCELINQRRKIPVRACRFYLTPPWGILKPHVDGLSQNRSPLGLNIPILGCENTRMIWYDCPEDNLEDGNYGFDNYTASKVIDMSRLTKIEETVIDVPTFVRTDTVHGIINAKNSPRLILSIRFYFSKSYGTEFNQVFDLTDL